MWSPESIIDAAFIPFYIALLFVNCFNCWKYGVRREYISLCLVSLFEIIGNVFVVTVNTNGSNSLTMALWGRTLSQLAFYPLLTSTLIFIRKWFNPEYHISLQRSRTWKKIDPRLKHYKPSIRFLHILLFAAFVCSLLGGIWSNPGNPKVTSGQDLQKVGNIIFIVAIIAILTFVVYLSISSINAAQRRDPILIQILIVMPILLVRSSFAAVQAFIRPGEPNVWFNLGLLQIPDLVSDTIYTVFGLALLKPAQRKELMKEWKRVGGSVGPSRKREIWERIVGRIRRPEEAMDEVKYRWKQGFAIRTVLYEYTEIPHNNTRPGGEQNPTLVFEPIGDEAFEERLMVLPVRESVLEWRDDKQFTARFAGDVFVIEITQREDMVKQVDSSTMETMY